VLLLTCVVGGDLQELLDACTIMGIEALVEVHSPNEMEFALSKGATSLLVNMWDRFSGRLFSDQVQCINGVDGDNLLSVNHYQRQEALQI
jgi:hypothetical protein